MPALELNDLSKRLADPEWIGRDPFSAAKDVADYCSIRGYDAEAQDLVLRSLDNLKAFGSASGIVNSLVRECGLFPYLDLQTSDTKDLFAAAMHRYPKLGDDFILHRQQRAILALLLDGKSVVLSAPTSFGKSALIDAVLSAGLHSNVLILVPTIALMDEMRRRLTRTFSPEWKVITHLEQEKHTKNIYVLTAERANLAEIGALDFYVIDEFYKLGNASEKDRHATLNKVWGFTYLTPALIRRRLGPSVGSGHG